MRYRRFLCAILCAWGAISLSAQSLDFEPGKKYISEEGLVSYSSEPALIKLLNPMVYMNLVSRETSKGNEYFAVISLPAKTLDKVSEDSSLQLKLANGAEMELPINERVVWDASKAPAKKSTEISLINLPYKITKEQIDLISSTSVNKVSIPGIEKTITFSIKGATMSNVMKRQFQAVNSLAAGGVQSVPSQSNTLAQSGSSNKTKQVTGEMINIHETPATKVIHVQNLRNMWFSPVHGDVFYVSEKGTGRVMLFNKKGEQLAVLNTSYPSDFEYKYRISFSDNRALVRLSDGKLAIIDPNGKVVNDLYSVKNLVSHPEYLPTEFVDGLAVVYIAHERERTVTEVANGYIPGDYHYLDINGKVVRPDLTVSRFARSIVDDYSPLYSQRPYPLKDGRRIHLNDETGLYGFLDAQHKTAIPFQYVKARDFSEGLAAVAIKRGNEELWGFIDINGKWVIEPTFSNQPKDFHEGYAIAKKKNGRYVYFDKTGKVCSEEYSGAFRFFDGKAMVIVDVNTYTQSRCLINKSFGTMQYYGPRFYEYSRIEHCDNTNTFHLEGGVYSPNGELLIKSTAPFYTDVTVYYENGSPKGYVNISGEIVLKFVENEF